jgi:CBS domain-containing protein
MRFQKGLGDASRGYLAVGSMPANDKRTVVGDVVAAARWADPSAATLEWLARLLRAEGVDLLRATSRELARGTPVWVDARADLVEVQRLMAANHIRSVPVLEDGEVVGIVDFVELALREDLGEPDGSGAIAG